MSATVLIVDDSATQVRLLAHALRGEGLEVLTAMDGEEALALVRERTPALLIVDAVMPGLDGYEVCRELRGDERLPGQPYVIMLTAGGHERDRERAEEAGVDEFMTKPFSPSQLRARVRAVLEEER